jgi:CRISPR-associated endonuclease/helicase Cas3
MSGEEADFIQFFKDATGFDPYRWQIEAATKGLPEVLPIPTGLGKTEGSVLAWAWRKLHRGLSEPLHLVYCLPMRSLVRQTVERLSACFNALAAEKRLQGVRVYQLMGGALDEGWAEEPDRPWVLVGTQDQLLSRALNRGYGMSRFDWPVHFGLLNQDCHWIIDEVQLMGPGLWTTAQMDWMRRKRFRALKLCRTTWMSATMGVEFLQTTDRKRDGCDKVEPFNPDFDGDANEELKRRRMAWRRTGMHQPAKGNKANPVPEQIASEAKAAHLPGTLTLIVCNTVKTAQDIFQKLEAGGTPKILLTSRFRAGDRRLAEEALRTFEARRSASSTGRVEGDPGLICVSTQVIEAGLDISAHHLWTEHAPWPSLIQRLGRLNRDGKDNESRAVVWKLTPENKRKHEGEDWIGPYRKVALDLAWSLLEKFAPLSAHMTAAQALEKLRQQTPDELAKALAIPPEPCPRALDVHSLFSTEPDLHGGFTDVSRFVRNTDPDADITVFWRDWQGLAPPSGEGLDGPPLDPNAETCAVAQWRLQEFLKTAHARAWLWNDEKELWQAVSVQDLKAGMTLMLRGDLGGYSQELGWTGERKHRLNDLPSPGPGRSLRDDQGAGAGYWSTMASHIADSRREAEGVCDALGIQGPIRTAVIEAAAWDDLGKAHPHWQGALPRGGPLDKEILAKFPEVLRVETSHDHAKSLRCDIEKILTALAQSNHTFTFGPLPDGPAESAGFVRLRWQLSRKIDYDTLRAIRDLRPRVRWARHRAFRPGLDDRGMRHEAASALVMWRRYITPNEPPYPALAVYLAGAHHGKVRTVLRSISRNGSDVFGVPFSPGALEFDGCSWPMDFSVAFDGADGEWTDDGFKITGPGWTGIVADLLGPWRGEADAAWTGAVAKDEPRALGPFALAWLEALVRVADWRASERPSQLIPPGGGG